MKHLAHVALACIAALSLAVLGCSDAASTADVVNEQAATLTSYSVVNGNIDTQYNVNKFCHPIYMGGSHAHAQARTMKWGIPATGGRIGQDRTNGWPASDVGAFVDSTGWNPPWPQETMAATYDCHLYADFNPPAGAWTGQTDTLDYYLSWPDSGTWNPVTVSAPGTNNPVTLWDGSAACWLDGLAHMSIGGKRAELVGVSTATPSGWSWQLQANGYAALFAEARCAYLGKPLVVSGWFTATAGSPAVANIRPSEGTCFFHKVVGNLDDGAVLWRKLFFWQLEVSGGVSEAYGYCVRY